MPPYHFHAGHTPVLLSIPHADTYVPEALARGLTAAAACLPDTDWHVDRLYAFARDMGAHVIRGNYSRVGVDLNRPPDDARLYAGPTTGLFPDVLFDGRPVFRDHHRFDRTPYLDRVWRPYHARIQRTLERLRQRHGYAVLFDAHSIRSLIPRLFDGRLPDFNIGTYDSRSLELSLEARLAETCHAFTDYTTVLNGRFKGGYTTRHYGTPEHGIHAVQLELAQRTYMDESYPFDYRPERATRVQQPLQRFMATLLDWRPSLN